MKQKLVELAAFSRGVLCIAALIASPGAFAGQFSGMKNSVDISGIKLGMTHAEARAQLEAYSPKLRIKELVNDQRQAVGFEAQDCALVPQNGIPACEHTFVVHEVNGRVYWIARGIIFKGNNKPTSAQVKDVLQKKYGALLTVKGVVSNAVEEYDGLVVNSSGDPDKRERSCNRKLGSSPYDPPFSFFPGADWSLRVDLFGKNDQFPMMLTTSLADCSSAFNELMRRQEAAKNIEQQRQREAVSNARAPKL